MHWRKEAGSIVTETPSAGALQQVELDHTLIVNLKSAEKVLLNRQQILWLLGELALRKTLPPRVSAENCMACVQP